MVLNPESNRFIASPELAFVIGAFLGDGSFVQDSDYHHFVKMAVRDLDLAEAFNKALSVVLSRRVNKIIKTRNDGKVYYEAKYSSQPLGLFLEQPLHKLTSFIESFPADFLHGLFSADGVWLCYNRKSKAATNYLAEQHESSSIARVSPSA